VDAETLELHTTVCFASAAGDALATIQVGLHGAPVARLDVQSMLASARHLDSKFVPQYSRIVEKRLFAFEGVQVCATDPDPPHADDGLISRKII
jgi:hypothetical protein